MTNKNRGWCTLMSILGFIFGIGYCFTLILIPIAVYCFIGARRYNDWAEMSDGELANYKKAFKSWAIFFSIVGFPLGLFSIIPAVKVSNNVVVTSVSEPEAEQTVEVHTEEAVAVPQASPTSKVDTIAKLDELKKEGLITEEEYERAKKEVIEGK